MTQQAQAEKFNKAIADIEDLRQRVEELEAFRERALPVVESIERVREKIRLSVENGTCIDCGEKI